MVSASGQSRRSREWRTFYARKAQEEEKRIGQDGSSSSFLPSFLPLLIVVDPPLLADAYEADVKTFVKYEGTARGRSIRRHPRGWRGERSTRRVAAREARFALLKAGNRLCIKRGVRNRRDSVTMDQPLLAPLGTPAAARHPSIPWNHYYPGERTTRNFAIGGRASRSTFLSTSKRVDYNTKGRCAFTWFAMRTIDVGNSGDIFPSKLFIHANLISQRKLSLEKLQEPCVILSGYVV